MGIGGVVKPGFYRDRVQGLASIERLRAGPAMRWGCEGCRSPWPPMGKPADKAHAVWRGQPGGRPCCAAHCGVALRLRGCATRHSGRLALHRAARSRAGVQLAPDPKPKPKVVPSPARCCKDRRNGADRRAAASAARSRAANLPVTRKAGCLRSPGRAPARSRRSRRSLNLKRISGGVRCPRSRSPAWHGRSRTTGRPPARRSSC